VTVPNMDTGRDIAAFLLDNRLAACVNIIPALESHYWWEGKLERNEESLLVIKTVRQLISEVIESVGKMHPYSVPEIIFLPLLDGNRDYLDWILESVKTSAGI